jgi:uncharacterized protein (DUF433 family)
LANVTEQRERSSKSKARLAAAEALIVRDPKVLGGEPCVKGTRIPAYLVGALARKQGVAEARAAYPTLPRQTIELVSLYVAANPRTHRPPEAALGAPKAAPKRGRAKKIEPT